MPIFCSQKAPHSWPTRSSRIWGRVFATSPVNRSHHPGWLLPPEHSFACTPFRKEKIYPSAFMLPIFPPFSTPLPPPHISSHLATKNIECEEKKIAELESFLKILKQMPGPCPYFLRFLKAPSGPEQGGTPAPDAESGWAVGVGGGGPISSELSCYSENRGGGGGAN